MFRVVLCGPKGQGSIAQGLLWVNFPTRISPEGAAKYGENRLRRFEPDRVRISSPFRAKRLFLPTQGKPWAKLSCPFGADPPGRLTDAKHIQSLGYRFHGPSGCRIKAPAFPNRAQLNSISRLRLPRFSHPLPISLINSPVADFVISVISIASSRAAAASEPETTG